MIKCTIKWMLMAAVVEGFSVHLQQSCIKLRQNNLLQSASFYDGRKGAQTGGNGLEMNAGKEVLADGEDKIVLSGARCGRRAVLVAGATVCEHIVKRQKG